jgi:hypothetical protein
VKNISSKLNLFSASRYQTTESVAAHHVLGYAAHIVLLISLLVFVGFQCAPASAIGDLGTTSVAIALADVPTTLSTEETNKRGHQLREAIQQKLKELAVDHKLTDRNFLSGDLVLKYVPIGCSFKDGRAIMESAGFNIRVVEFTPKHFGLSGGTLLSPVLSLTSIEAGIDLLPTVPNDLKSGIGAARLAIYITNL